MTTRILFAAVLTVISLGSPAYAITVSAGVKPHLLAAQSALAAGNVQNALAELDLAERAPGKTSIDEVMINRFALSAHAKLNDMAAADLDAEAAADIVMNDPGAADSGDMFSIFKIALQLALNAKHNDKASRYADRLQGLTPATDAATLGLISQAHYLGGDYASAAASAQHNMAQAVAQGQAPSNNDLQVLLATQVRQHDEEGAERTLETLVRYYNKPDDWQQILSVVMSAKGMRDTDMVYLGRLYSLVGIKGVASDASIYGSVANHLGLYGDAIAARGLGGTGFNLNDQTINSDRNGMHAQIAAGSNQSGQYNVKLAEALYGYGMYSEAEKAARLAQSKGGMADPGEAQMIIGMAQVAQGQCEAAKTTFAEVRAGGPVTPRIARLWSYCSNFTVAAQPQPVAIAQPVKLPPAGDPLADANAGMTALNNQDFGLAVQLFSRALNSPKLPSNAKESVFLERGYAYMGEGQKNMAAADADSALRIEPKDQDAVRLRTQANSQ